MKNEYDIINKKSKENVNKKRKSALGLKRFFKATFLFLLVVVVYGLSYHFSGFYKTNVRLLTLVVCMALGFILFYIIYSIFSLFAKISYDKKSKKPKMEAFVYYDDLNAMLCSKKYDFTYDFNKSLTENLGVIFEKSASLVHDISIKCNKDGKYYYLNCTSIDLLLVFGDIVDGLHNKVDGFFKLLNLQDKPLNFVEKRLVDLVEKDKQLAGENLGLKEESNFKKFVTKIKENLLNISGKVTTYVFKHQIEESANDVIKFMGEEAFKVYGQDKISTKKLKGENYNG